jgi:hypothetical protein
MTERKQVTVTKGKREGKNKHYKREKKRRRNGEI